MTDGRETGATDVFRATGAGKDACRGQRHARPRSADGSSTERYAALQDGRCSRGSMHGSRGVESALTQRAGAGLGALSLVLGPCYPNRLRPGLANDALAPSHYCASVLRPPKQTLETRQSMSWHP